MTPNPEHDTLLHSTRWIHVTRSHHVVYLFGPCRFPGQLLLPVMHGKHVAAYRWPAIDEMYDKLSRYWAEIPPTARLSTANVRLNFCSDTLSI